jgi:ketosteroid isomerase-like protein
VALNDTAPTVRRATLAYEIARLESEKSRAGSLPTIDLEGSYQRGRTRSDGSQLSSNFNYSGPTMQSSIGVTLRLPLFAGFSIQNRLKETLALEDQSRSNLDAARRGAGQSTRQAFFGVQSGLAQVRALEAAESSSQLALEATQLGYKVGVRVNVDVLNAQTQLYTTRRDLARARYDVLLNGLRLRQAAGPLKADDLRALNQLLKPVVAEQSPASSSSSGEAAGASTAATPLPVRAQGMATASAPLPQQARGASAEAAPAVQQRLQGWAAAWADKDTDAYLGFYAPDFVPAQGTRAQWKARRQAAIGDRPGAIGVTLSRVQAREIAPDTVETRFMQSYRSGNVRANAARTIVWKRIDGQWFIVAESGR